MLNISMKFDLELYPYGYINLIKNKNVVNSFSDIDTKNENLNVTNKIYLKIPSCSINLDKILEAWKDINIDLHVIIAKCGKYFDKELFYFREKNLKIKNVHPLIETNDIFNASFIKKISKSDIKEIFIGRNDLVNIMKNDRKEVDNIIKLYKHRFKTYIGGFSEEILETRKAGDCNSCRNFILDGENEKVYTEKEKDFLKGALISEYDLQKL